MKHINYTEKFEQIQNFLQEYDIYVDETKEIVFRCSEYKFSIKRTE
jgi:hypothetical protein